MLKNMFNFIWPLMRPYKKWYFLMFQATILTGFYFPMNNFAIKSVVDAFTTDATIQLNQILFPVTIFVLAQLGLEISWRISEFAAWHVEPYVNQAIILKPYDYIQHHSYSYFQNNPSGMIISKLKGIVDGFEMIKIEIHQD